MNEQLQELNKLLLAEKSALSSEIARLKSLAQLVIISDTITRKKYPSRRVNNSSQRKQVSGFGESTLEKNVTFSMDEHIPFFLKRIHFSQWLTATLGTVPILRYLPNAGFPNDGNGTQFYGHDFRFRISVNGERPLDEDWRDSSELTGPLHSTFVFASEQELPLGGTLKVEIQELADSAVGDSYEMWVTVDGVEAQDDRVNAALKEKEQCDG